MVEKDNRAARKRARMLRMGVLLAVLATSTGIGLVHQTVQGVAPAGVDALCPFGAIESAYSLLTSNTFVPKVAASSVVLLAAVLLIALVFRRSFCGMICPLGTLQELFGRLGAKLFGRRREVPASVDRPLRYLKYVVLAVFTVWTWAAGELVMRAYDPWATYHHLTSAELLTTFPVGLAVLGVSLGGSLAYDRFFCKYLCPMGAFLSLISRFSVYKVRREAVACIDCGACDKACPANVTVSKAGTVEDPECINCNECVNSCPAKGALEVRPARTGRRLETGVAVGAVAAAFLLVVGVTTATGTFSWTTKSLTAQAAEATAAGAAFDPGTINGRSSIREVSSASGVAEADILARFGVPAAEAMKPMKEIKDTYGFSPEDVKAFVEERLGRAK
jgi:polyferredoxin